MHGRNELQYPVFDQKYLNVLIYSAVRRQVHADTHTESHTQWNGVMVHTLSKNVYVPLFIQKVKGGGRPGGGLQGRTSEEPSDTNTGSSTSLGHRGASVTEERGQMNTRSLPG